MKAILAALLVATSLLACSVEPQARLVGTLERDRVELSVESNEPIVSILVADGETVTAGQLLLTQDASRHQARLQQQLARRDVAAAKLAELQRGTRPEQVAEARARLSASEAVTANALLEWQRQQQLVARGVGQQAALDSARNGHAEAVASEQAGRMNLERLLNGATHEQLLQSEAELASAEAAVGQAQLDLERTRLVAPVAGMLDKVWFEVGERPLPGQRVAVILDNARPYARVYVPEALRSQVQPGRSLKVLADGHDTPLEGVVSWVSSDASFTPYFALTEYDRSRLSYLAELELPGAADLPSGLPLSVMLD